ncbi:MAG: hypothetical protein ACRDV4_04890 [Acidimicrobiales bacterium]
MPYVLGISGFGILDVILVDRSPHRGYGHNALFGRPVTDLFGLVVEVRRFVSTGALGFHRGLLALGLPTAEQFSLLPLFSTS